MRMGFPASDMELLRYVLITCAGFVSIVSGQTSLQPQVVSTFIYTRYGDRTPLALPPFPVLTPLGANQLYQAGNLVRQRYVAPFAFDSEDQSAPILNISPFQINNEELTILATNEQYVAASAQAFMQGLYPPLASGSNFTYIPGISILADGSNVVAPLNGVQYANIQTLSINDLNSIWIAGSQDCPAYDAAVADYYETPEFYGIEGYTRNFYNSLQPDFLNGFFINASVGYFDAYYLWDYLNYAYIHNATVAELLTTAQLTEAKILATDLIFAINANVSDTSISENESIINLAGRTFAARVLQAFYTSIYTQGQRDKMTLMFGGFEPMIAFAALTNLISPQNSAFLSMPGPASSFIFELFALGGDDNGTYPDISELFVRFFFQNGTETDSSLIAYPLFGFSPSVITMSFSDFVASMERIMIYNIESWCTTCDSNRVFCPAFENSDGLLNPKTGSESHKSLSSAVSGLIGAVVALFVAALIFAAIMLLAGCRVQRVHRKRRSELGGFKGAEKLASDQDLTLPKGGAGATVTNSEDKPAHGHERVGSWELRDQAKEEDLQRSVMGAQLSQPNRPSFEDDDIPITHNTIPVKPHDHV